jgi:uncharacterized repeat protein (TIGR03803 family)
LAGRSQAFAASESVLWSFGNGNDGNTPLASLVMDKSGNLYGTTQDGGIYGGPNVNQGGDGTVFELTPPSSAGGPWTESILWDFGNGTDGSGPFAGLLMDANGNLYGTTDAGGMNGYGTVFELTPLSPAGGLWTESVLWNFGNGTDGAYPRAGLIMDTSGNL